MAAPNPLVVAAGMPTVLVLDTNIVLDLLVFDDPALAALRKHLDGGVVRWIASIAMRAEFARVLAYPAIAPRLQLHGARFKSPGAMMALFDSLSQTVPEAANAPVRCSDPDDQIFIDLALAHTACLLSKDNAVLRLRKQLVIRGAIVQNSWSWP